MRLGVLMPDDGVPVVAALGAIGPDKGARRIEQLVERMRALDLALRIVVIGYLDVEHGPWQSDDARLTVHGRYDPRDLAAWLAHYRAQFVIFPSAGPETFSYTLSESWRAGVPVVVPPIGALAERVAATDAGWVLTEQQWADDAAMLARIASLASSDAAADRQRAAANARSAPLAALATMAEQTLARYAAAVANVQPRPCAPFTNLRVRDALGYREWKPPLDVGPTVTDAMPPIVAEIAPAGMMTRVARRALAMRATPMGRLLYRMTPTPLIDALKSRLDG
jgi:hypothetical protein